jgi:hypothetical protein
VATIEMLPRREPNLYLEWGSEALETARKEQQSTTSHFFSFCHSSSVYFEADD